MFGKRWHVFVSSRCDSGASCSGNCTDHWLASTPVTAPLVYRVCGKCRGDLDVQSDGESVPDEGRGQPRLQVAAGVGVGHAGGPEGNSPDLTAPAQWAKSRGYWLVTRCQQAAAFRMVRNRLYFLRIHHITEALMRERSGCSSERSAPYGDRLSCIRYASVRYSVPTRLIRVTVRVVQDHGAPLVVEPATGEIVAEHELAARGTASVLGAHYDRRRPPAPVVGRHRKRLSSTGSAHSARTRKRSWSGPPRSMGV